MRATGQNQFQFKNLCAILDLPPPPDKLITAERKVLKVAKKVAKQSMKEAAAVLASRSPNGKDFLVRVDGTWQKRGFQSKNGSRCISGNWKDFGCQSQV